ncbi:MAG TPA: hypothetical protein VIQ05_02090 [Tardiphaga sp.]
MSEAERTTKQRDRAIAENENAQQISGDVRVSVWAIGLAVLVGVTVFGWVLLR